MALSSEFHGREEDGNKVLFLLEEVHSGRGRILLVEGGPGTGKTALLNAAECHARRRGFTILRQRADGTPPDRATTPGSLLEQMEARVAEQAALGPVLVTLDDAHRAGPPWQPVLAALPALAETYPLLWALTRRPGQGGTAVERLFRRPGRHAVRLSLGPLCARAVDELIVATLGAPADPRVRALVAAAGGEPQLTVEMLRGLREEGAVVVRAGRAELVRADLPHRVVAVVQDRIHPLSAKARQTLQVAAAFGEAFAVHHVARMLREPTATLLPALDELLAAGLLSPRGERMAFTHGLIARSVRESVPPSVRRALHHEAAVMLADDAPTADPDGAAAPSAAPAAPATAAPPTGPAAGPADEAGLLLARALCDARPGHDADAPATGGDRWTPGQQTVLAATDAAARLWESGALTESLAKASAAVAACDAGTPPAWRLQARLGLVRKLGHRHELAAATALLDQAGPGDETHTAAVLIARAGLHLRAGRLGEARDDALAAIRQAGAAGARPLIAAALTRLAAVALRAGDLTEAAECLRRCRAEPPEAAAACAAEGDWIALRLVAERDGPRRALDHLFRHCPGLPERRQLFAEEPAAAAWLARVAIAAGDPDPGKAALRTVECLAARNLDFTGLAVAAAHARGLLNGDADRLAEAAAGQREPWAAAWAAEDLGLRLLQEPGADPDAAVRHLTTARDRFAAIGAERDTARLADRLRALGVLRPGSAAGRTPGGWDSLNDMERTIAALVDQGMTNRQIATRVYLSPHTVNYHLRQIYRKLNIRTRLELARLVHRQRSTADPGPVPQETTAGRGAPRAVST